MFIILQIVLLIKIPEHIHCATEGLWFLVLWSNKINTSSSKSLSERKKDTHLNKMATYYIHQLALPFDLNVFGPMMYSTKNVGLFIEICFSIVNSWHLTKYPLYCAHFKIRSTVLWIPCFWISHMLFACYSSVQGPFAPC